MRRIHRDYLLIAGMFLSGCYVLLTGLTADLLGLHQFAFHRYAGYICAALIASHLLLNWRRLTSYVRRLRTRNTREIATAPREVRPSLPRRSFLLTAAGAAVGYLLGRFVPRLSTYELKWDATDPGVDYHRLSSPSQMQSAATIFEWGGRPPVHKTYADAQRIALPAVGDYRGMFLEEAIAARRSRRRFSGQPLSLEQLSLLLYAALGITDEQSGFRAAPSAGALYPIEAYPVVHNVTGLEPGIYHYAVDSHSLELLESGDHRTAVMQAGVWQEFLSQANVCIALSTIFQRTRWKYRERAYRYDLLEAGHIGQNLYLAATSMGLGACAVGAFLDGQLNSLLDLDDQEEAALYLLAVGSV